MTRFQTGGKGRTPRMAHVLRLHLMTGQRRGELALFSMVGYDPFGQGAGLANPSRTFPERVLNHAQEKIPNTWRFGTCQARSRLVAR